MDTKPKLRLLPPWQQFRCPKCKRLLFEGRLAAGSRIETYCRHCRAPRDLIVFEADHAA